jgi:hypothetical protein
MEGIEEWMQIKDYENYEVSSLGQVRNKKTNRILKSSSKGGYLSVGLTNEINKKSFAVHRLVALAFIENPENKPTVNHKDRNKINNKLENLEWATHLEQNLHKTKSTNIRVHALKVLKICSKTNVILEMYNSLKEAAEWIIQNNLSKIKNNNYKSVMSKISAVINNKINCNTSFGYKWTLHKNNTDENEIWKQIPIHLTNNVEHYYISNYGKIKNKNKIKTNFCINNGYQVVSIKYKLYYLHRLVALTFLENKENKELVNHKDGNKLNNLLENLEWTTSLENNLHSIKNGLSKTRKKVIQYDSNMNKMQEFNSIIECSKSLNIGKSCISNSCNGKYKSTKCGYIFKYSK